MKVKVNFRFEFQGMVTKEPVIVEAVVDDQYTDHVIKSGPRSSEFELISLKISEIEGEEVDYDNSLCITDMAPAILQIMSMISSNLIRGNYEPV